ncbi:50S ribosomal protein L17 [Candidatus Saccharibacteria bacterium]|nr:50S ribosomal protein L17 [Candidatus Saccharibacteria bacterium]MBQ6410305.1 50S ribosomal protein L17 [Candidatus Saccharibacteria bacterium]
MHRHSYKGRKFGRETDQRLALIRSLECALIENQSITTTLARAKEIRREAEKLVSMARKGGLNNRRLIIARLNSVSCGNLLVDVVAPQVKRDSGYLRIEHAGYRKGDNAEMGTISFVDEIDYSNKTEKPAKAEKKADKKAELKKSAAKKSAEKEDK